MRSSTGIICITPLSRRDDDGEGTSASVASQVDLAGQPAPGPAEALVVAVLERLAASTRNAWWALAGTGGVLVSPAGCRVNTNHGPVDPAFRVGFGLEGSQESVPGAIR